MRMQYAQNDTLRKRSTGYTPGLGSLASVKSDFQRFPT